MTLQEHFVYSCLTSPKKDFPPKEKSYPGDVLHYLDDSFYVYDGTKWITMEECNKIIYNVSL